MYLTVQSFSFFSISQNNQSSGFPNTSRYSFHLLILCPYCIYNNLMFTTSNQMNMNGEESVISQGLSAVINESVLQSRTSSAYR